MSTALPNRLHKLSHLVNDAEVAHSHPPTFTIQNTTAGTGRICTVAPGGDPDVLHRLVECLAPPYLIIYVLHTPRGEGEPGRYQSPELDAQEWQAFIGRFGAFFGGDARHDLWVHSPTDSATVVWDRHNLIFAYGPIDKYERALRELGFTEGVPRIPVPHVHHYRDEFDADAAAVLAHLEWRRTALRPEDEQ